jgi:pimeloyl-ACP methyl ester carboxylesterase
MGLSLPDVPGVEHRWVATSRIEVHVAEAGSGEPLVLLHGWPQHWYAWRRVIPRLAEKYRVVCPDLRGLGWSEAPRDGYEKESLASDLLALLDALELQRVKLMGHDWGAFVGYLAAFRSPHRIERFVALNDIHPWTRISVRDAWEGWRLWYQVLLAMPALGAWTLRQRPSFVRTLIRHWSAVDSWSDAELDAFIEPLREPLRAQASVQYYRRFVLRELPSMLAGRYRRSSRLRTPTLLLFGEEDGVIRPYQLRGYEPHADRMQLELVPGAGHFIAEEAPDLVADRALEFFSAA